MATRTATRAPRPTDKMVAFMRKLASERVATSLGTTPSERLVALDAWLLTTEADKFECMSRIDWLKAQPLDRQREADPVVLTRGVYELNGEIFVVKKAKQSERLYAQRVVEIRGERLTEAGDKVNFELEYARGVIFKLRPDHQMTKARAAEFLTRYARCLVCGRALKDATSVERGVGPVCVTYFA